VSIHPAGGIRAQLEASGIPADIRLQQRGERVAASAVLTSSGTMSMHCALAGIPGAIAYRTDPLTYLIARWIVRVPFLGIANLLLEEPMYPEYIQGAATSAALARELDSCFTDPLRRERTGEQTKRLAAMLARPAGDNEADWLLRKLG
jgi:lipid-A-disaccharide synthase